MKTALVRVDPVAPESKTLQGPAEVLRQGGLVAFPTETVYGLGACALDEDAVKKIFLAKGRPPTNPLIIHVLDIEEARRLVRHWPEQARQLAEAFWPGPLTLVLKRAAKVPDVVSAGLDSVAIRCPAHPVARELLRLAGCPVAAPSANRYTELSPTTAEHVLKGLDGRVDVIVDGGSCEYGLESTLVSLLNEEAEILRPGSIPHSELKRVVSVKELQRGQIVDESEARPSPGLSKRHYAPKATLSVVGNEVFDELWKGSVADVGLIALGPRQGTGATKLSLPAVPYEYGHELYAALHQLDSLGLEAIYVESPPEDEAWAAILDRLSRAMA